MAGIGATYVDLLDIEKQKNPDGSIAVVLEQLMELNPMLQDAIAVQCNNGTTHRHSIRTGLPSVAWGKLYQGIPQSKSTYAQVDDATGFVEAMSTIDKRVLDISGNPAAIRMNEARGFLEAVAQEVQATMIYGNSNSAPEEFMGLAPRFNSTTAANGNQIIDGGGAGADNTSIWMVTWAEHACHTIYPGGTMAGIEREDKGEQRVLDASGNPYYVMEELFRQHVGICVKDWRYVVRIANIDVSDMQGGSVDMFALLRKGYWQLENRRHPRGGKICIYANSDVCEALDAQATPTINTGATTTSGNIRYSPSEVEGKEIMTYRGIPIRETDAILNTEAVVS